MKKKKQTNILEERLENLVNSGNLYTIWGFLLIIMGVIFGGLLGAVVGVIAGLLLMKFTKNTKLSHFKKISISLLITVIGIILYFGVAILFFFMFMS